MCTTAYIQPPQIRSQDMKEELTPASTVSLITLITQLNKLLTTPGFSTVLPTGPIYRFPHFDTAALEKGKTCAMVSPTVDK